MSEDNYEERFQEHCSKCNHDLEVFRKRIYAQCVMFRKLDQNNEAGISNKLGEIYSEYKHIIDSLDDSIGYTNRINFRGKDPIQTYRSSMLFTLIAFLESELNELCKIISIRNGLETYIPNKETRMLKDHKKYIKNKTDLNLLFDDDLWKHLNTVYEVRTVLVHYDGIVRIPPDKKTLNSSEFKTYRKLKAYLDKTKLINMFGHDYQVTIGGKVRKPEAVTVTLEKNFVKNVIEYIEKWLLDAINNLRSVEIPRIDKNLLPEW